MTEYENPWESRPQARNGYFWLWTPPENGGPDLRIVYVNTEYDRELGALAVEVDVLGGTEETLVTLSDDGKTIETNPQFDGCKFLGPIPEPMEPLPES